jgi:hydrogenase/urease accessory protein HupE
MKRLIAFAALVPSAALAHPGDHSHAGVAANLHHLLTEPDHLAMLAAAVLAVALLAYLRKGRAE